MKNIILNVLLNKNKVSFFIIIFLIFFNLILELLGLSLFYPLIKILLDKENFLNFFENFFFYEYMMVLSYNYLLLLILFLIFLTFFTKNICLLLSLYFQNKFFEIFQINITNNLFGNYLNKEFIFFSNENSSNLLRNLRGETASVLMFFQSFVNFITELLVCLGILIFLIIANPKTTILLISIIIPISFLYTLLTKKRISSLANERIFLDGLINKNFLESISAIKEIKIYRKEKIFRDYVNINLKKFFKINILYSIFSAIPRYFLEIFIILALLLIIYLLETNIISTTNDTIVVVGILVVASVRILPGLSRILINFQNIKYRLPSVKLLNSEILKLNEKNENIYTDKINEISKPFLEKKQFDIEIRNLNFQYNSNSRYIIKNLNMKFFSNKIYGIIGKTGSGKSTLVDLISGFYRPTSGNIIVNGEDISNIIRSWRNNFGYVSQKIFVFDDTIEKNISLEINENNIDKSKLDEVLTMSEIKDFVLELPEGLKTRVGQNGAKLSGGQIQRLSIARALYQDPKIIIFDEATNALDRDTENKILEMIVNIKKNKLIFIVTHNTNPLKICDDTIEINSYGECKIINKK